MIKALFICLALFLLLIHLSSRFPGGLCYCYGYDSKLRARVAGQYLTPQIAYTVNFVFRYRHQRLVNIYNPLRYKVDGEDETKVFIIYPTDKRGDRWFCAPLYKFTSQHTTADLLFEFETRRFDLLVVGFEFQPLEEKVEQVFEEYQDIVEVASQHLFYTSLDELKQVLSRGVHLNGYTRWFSINEKGERSHMISIKDCLIPNKDFPSRYRSHFYSRFPGSFYQTNNKGFKTHVKPQLLSPSITYIVSVILFNYTSNGKQAYVDPRYRLSGETTTSIVDLANNIDEDDDPLYMAELYQFTSDGSIVDLEIIFENSGTNINGVEGIMFQPLEIVEDQVSKDDKVENIQTISYSESDTNWEQKLPDDYEEMLDLTNDSLFWITKKELYLILRRGFLINNGQVWFSIDKHGKKCSMLSATATWVIDDENSACESSHESRFGEVLVITSGHKFEIKIEIKSKVVSREEKYACYLVYKLPQDQSTFEAPLSVCKNYYIRGQYIYLVSPPVTPVIGSNLDENSYNPLNRYKGNAIPQQRSDGWMEVKAWVVQTTKSIPTCLEFEHPGKKTLKGLMVQGIELRPI